jgi:hypothetical protein
MPKNALITTLAYKHWGSNACQGGMRGDMTEGGKKARFGGKSEGDRKCLCWRYNLEKQGIR